MAVAIAALAVALGGAAFAALPGSNGAVHACYQKNSGDLRIVDAADTCRNGEQAIAWNQRGPQGPPGAQVVARLRGGPFATRAGIFEPVPLSRDSWTQHAGEFQVVHVDMRAAQPICTMQLLLFLDGELVESFLLGPFGTSPPRAFLQVPLFEPDAPATHTLSAQIRANAICSPNDRTGVLEYLKANVVSFSWSAVALLRRCRQRDVPSCRVPEHA